MPPSRANDPERSNYIAANRDMWNRTAEVHAASRLEDLEKAFRDPSFTLLDEIETRALVAAGVAGADVVQLSCNNGRELLCVERLGANRCLGVDISEKFIGQAGVLAEAAGSSAEFLAADVYEIPADYDASFDLAYVTIGALGWFPDLRAWFAVAARLLRPGGRLLIYEMHPILDMFDAQDGPVLKHSYFRTDPYVEDAAPDYYDPGTIVEGTSYWFHHKVSDLLNGAIEAGFAIRRFDEFDHDISLVFRAFQELAARPPLSYLLTAEKTP